MSAPVLPVCAWLGRRRGVIDSRQRDLVAVLIELERLAS